MNLQQDTKTKIEKIGLTAFFVLFFGMIFIGSWSFSAESFMFPAFLSGTALILVLLSILHPYLPIHTSSNDMDDAKPGTWQRPTVQKRNMYFIFLYTGVFSVLAYVFGFYIAAVISICGYVYFVRQSFNNNLWALVILCVVVLGLVYVFDMSFGHYYANGVLYQFSK